MRAALAALAGVAAVMLGVPAYADPLADLPRGALVRSPWLDDGPARIAASSSAGSYASRHAAVDVFDHAGPFGVALAGELGDATDWNGQRASLAIDVRAGAHALRFGAGIVRAVDTGGDGPVMENDMTLLTRAVGEQRLLGAYLQDIVRPTESLELGGAISLDWWQDLTREHYAAPGADAMDQATPAALHPSGKLGARQHLGDVSVGATGFANAPATDALRPRVQLDPARLTGVELEASWHPSAGWLATASFTPVAHVSEAKAPPAGSTLVLDPRQRAAALVSYDDPSVLTFAAQVRYVDSSLDHDLDLAVSHARALYDGLVGRRLGEGVSGYVTVENILDSRAGTATPPRLFMVGLKFDSTRF